MTIQELLLSKGFVENTDYSFDGVTLTALEKTRQVEQIIHHEAEPAQTDENGNETIPAKEAYDETILVDETYKENIPDLQSLKSEIVSKEDLALLINEYLQGKERVENDNGMNLSNGTIVRWGFITPEQPTIDQLFDLIEPTKNKLNQEQINKEALDYLASTDWMITRFSETGVEIPQDIKDERAAARQRIIK